MHVKLCVFNNLIEFPKKNNLIECLKEQYNSKFIG